MKKKRTAYDYEKMCCPPIQKQTRKFGNIEAYVDPENRVRFQLEDYIEFLSKDEEFKG